MTHADPVVIDDELLRGWPLPQPGIAADKEERGHVLVVAGSREMPGACWLAATAALRAGAGKLVVASVASVAPGLALALPEARVIALPESPGGGLLEVGADHLEHVLGKVDALLLGPGWADKDASLAFARRVVDRLGESTALVLDAMAMDIVVGEGAALEAGAPGAGGKSRSSARPSRLLTPHAGEMAHLLQVSKDEVCADPQACARTAAERWNCVVAMKGATTFIAAPDGRLWRHDAEAPGLGTSGSGDTLAGIVVGLAARGAALEQALAWGVALHARAGGVLAAKRGPLGYLARELLQEIPQLMHALTAPAAAAENAADDAVSRPA